LPTNTNKICSQFTVESYWLKKKDCICFEDAVLFWWRTWNYVYWNCLHSMFRNLGKIGAYRLIIYYFNFWRRRIRFEFLERACFFSIGNLVPGNAATSRHCLLVENNSRSSVIQALISLHFPAIWPEKLIISTLRSASRNNIRYNVTM